MRHTPTRYLMTLALTLTVWLACGEPTDSPEDCTVSERFNEITQLCETCPAVTEPQCREGCGFRIVDDADGCPTAVCNDTCEGCPQGQRFDEDTFLCVDDPTAAAPEAIDP